MTRFQPTDPSVMRTAAIHSVLLNYSSLCETLETVNAETHDECGRKAGRYLAQMEQFSTFFGLNLSHLIFSGTEQLSLTLQLMERYHYPRGSERTFSALRRLKTFLRSTMTQERLNHAMLL